MRAPVVVVSFFIVYGDVYKRYIEVFVTAIALLFLVVVLCFSSTKDVAETPHLPMA